METAPQDAPASAPVSMWQRPPGWVLTGIIAANLLVIMWATSVPGWNVVLVLLGGGLLAVLLLCWIVRLLACVTGPPGVDPATGAIWLRRRRTRVTFAVAAVPIGLLVTMGLVKIDAPATTRWWLSRSALEAEVEAITARGTNGAQGLRIDRRVGLYEIRTVYAFGGSVVFAEATGGFFGGGGFAYLPNGPQAGVQDPTLERPTFRSLGDGWYSWTASF